MREYRPSTFLERFEQLRKSRGDVSEQALLIGAGLSKDAVRQVRSGRSRSLTGSNLFKLAATTRVSIDWLLGLTDAPVLCAPASKRKRG